MKARLPPLGPGRGHPLTPELIKLCSAEFSRSLEFPPSPSSAAGQPVCEQRPWSSGLTGRKQSPEVRGWGVGRGQDPAAWTPRKLQTPPPCPGETRRGGGGPSLAFRGSLLGKPSTPTCTDTN